MNLSMQGIILIIRPPIQELQDKVGTYEACGAGDKDNLGII